MGRIFKSWNYCVQIKVVIDWWTMVLVIGQGPKNMCKSQCAVVFIYQLDHTKSLPLMWNMLRVLFSFF